MIKSLILIITTIIQTKYSFVSRPSHFSSKQCITRSPTLLFYFTQVSSEISAVNSRLCRNKSSMELNFGFFWDDDLPNLFGINPVEATIIFGFLYYIYGAEELYDNAREAGKLFSTYAPVVKEVVFNIYNEFKDYIDEDKQRDEMKKRGIDVSTIPRRTTNLIERVQESLNMLSEMTEQKGGMSEEIQTGLRPELFEMSKGNNGSNGGPNKTKNRMKKKDILKSKNIDLDRIINSDKQVDEINIKNEIDRSFNLVQERLNSMTNARQNEIKDQRLLSTSFAAASSADFSDLNGDQNRDIEEMGTATRSQTNPTKSFMLGPNMDEYPFPDAASELLLPQTVKPDSGMSKFQQQLSGTWNQKVLEREKVIGPLVPFQGSISDSSTDWTDWEDPNNFTGDISTNALSSQSTLIASQASTSAAYDEYGMPLDIAASLMPQPVLASPIAYDNDMSNTDVKSSFDSLPIPQNQASGISQLEVPLKLLSSASSSAVSIAVLSILAELDRDYLSIRQRMIDSMLKVEQITQRSPALTNSARTMTPTNKTVNIGDEAQVTSHDENVKVISELPIAASKSNSIRNEAERRSISIDQQNLNGFMSAASRSMSQDTFLPPLLSKTSTDLNQSMLKSSIRRKYWPRTVEVD